MTTGPSKTLEDNLVEVVGTLVIEVALHQRRMRLALRVAVVGLLLIIAASAGALLLAIDTRGRVTQTQVTLSRSPCANLTAAECYRKLKAAATDESRSSPPRRGGQRSHRRDRARDRLPPGAPSSQAPARAPRLSPQPPRANPKTSRPKHPSSSPPASSAPPSQATPPPSGGAPPSSDRPPVDIRTPPLTPLPPTTVCVQGVVGINCP